MAGRPSEDALEMKAEQIKEGELGPGNHVETKYESVVFLLRDYLR